MLLYNFIVCFEDCGDRILLYLTRVRHSYIFTAEQKYTRPMDI